MKNYLFLFGILLSLFLISSVNALSCYQESANVSNQVGTDGNCGLNYTGNYYMTGTNTGGAWDGNWNTTDGNNGYYSFYINYSKPLNIYSAYGAIWQVKRITNGGLSSVTSNNTIPTSCFNNDSQIHLKLRTFFSGFSNHLEYSCLNSSGYSVFIPDYTDISCGVGEGCIYEEGIYWIMPPLLENNQTFNSQVISTTNNNFLINLNYDSSNYSISFVNLIYNNTIYTGSQSYSSGNNIIYFANTTAPIVASSKNISFYWNIGLTNSTGTYYYNSSFQNQTDSPIAIDNCNTYHNVIINFTNYDQDSLTPLNPSTYNIQATISTITGQQVVTTYANNITANSAALCLSANLTNSYRLDLVTQWNGGATYYTQFYNIQNYTLNNLTMSQNISLYDLLTANGYPFQIIIKGSNYLPLTNAIVEIDRQYVQSGGYKAIEIPLTDSTGSTIGHFLIANNQLYNIYIKQNGQLLYSFLNQQPYCNTNLELCTMSFNIPPNQIIPSTQNGNSGIYILNNSYTDSTQTYNILFNSVSGNPQIVNITGFINDNNLNISVCSSQVTSSSGSLNCIIPLSYQNQSVMILVTSNGNTALTDYILTGSNYISSIFSKSRYILAAFLIPAIVLMAGGTAAIGAIAFIFGLIICVLLFVVNGTAIGASSFVIFFVIAAIIFIIKSQSGGIKNG